MNSRVLNRSRAPEPANSDTVPVQEHGAGAVVKPITPAAAPPRIKVWDLPTRLFHWSLVVAFTVAVVSGELGGEWMALHGKAGLAIVGLVAFRLVWGVVGSTYARFASFVPTPARLRAYAKGRWEADGRHGHNPLGALSVLALLALLAVQAGSGLFANDDIAFTGPLYNLIGEDLAARLTGWHRQIAYALLALVALHVAAIFVYLQLKKNNLITPMLTGWKALRHDAQAPAAGRRRASPLARALALVLALSVAAGAVVLASGVWIAAPVPSAPVVQQATTPAW